MLKFADQITGVRSWRRTALVALMFLAAMPLAYAQWQWVDAQGRKVFSDVGPPPDVPEKDILRRPGPRPTPALPADSADAPAAAQPAPAPAVASGKDKELEARKKAAEQAELAKQRAAQAKLAKDRAENCERARSAKNVLNSGVRVATANAQGEREIMDDQRRAQEIRRLDDIIRQDCGPMPVPMDR